MNDAPLLPTSSAASMQRAIKAWLNTCTELPDSIPTSATFYIDWSPKDYDGTQTADNKRFTAIDHVEHYEPITFEDLPENESGITFSTIQAAAYVRRYILGGYKAEYRFRVIYRVLPSNDGEMLDAVEALQKIGAWCESSPPPALDGAVNVNVRRTSDAAILAAYEDGSNDYGLELTISWEVF